MLSTGKYYALVTVVELLPNNRATVRHYNSTSGQFDGKEDIIYSGVITWQTRADWVDPYQSLIGTRLADRPVTTVVNALTSWRSLLPRLANDVLAEIFLNHGASLWLLQTYQVGGWDEDIEPIAPTKLWI